MHEKLLQPVVKISIYLNIKEMKENKYFRIFIRPTRYIRTKKNDLKKKKIKTIYIVPLVPTASPLQNQISFFYC